MSITLDIESLINNPIELDKKWLEEFCLMQNCTLPLQPDVFQLAKKWFSEGYTYSDIAFEIAFREECYPGFNKQGGMFHA